MEIWSLGSGVEDYPNSQTLSAYLTLHQTLAQFQIGAMLLGDARNDGEAEPAPFGFLPHETVETL